MSQDHGMNMSMTMTPPMPMPSSPPSMSPSQAMRQTFFWGDDVVLLFDGWPGSGRPGMYALALAAVLLAALVAEILSVAPNLKPSLKPAAGAVVHAAVQALRMTFLYLVMLSVMSLNVGVFVAAVAGHAVGRLLVKYRELAAVAKAAGLGS